MKVAVVTGAARSLGRGYAEAMARDDAMIVVGGVGKSSSCAAVGARLAQRGEQVLIIDLDQNRTLERWGRKANVPGLTVKAIEQR